MDIQEINRLMEDSSLMTENTLEELRLITEEYPFFQVSRMLYLKNLSKLKDEHYSSELENSVMALSDRKKLFELIEKEKYGFNGPLDSVVEGYEKDTFSLIDAFLSEDTNILGPVPSEKELLIQPSVSADYIFWATDNQENKKGEVSESIKLCHHELIDSFIENDRNREVGERIYTSLDENPPMPESVKKLDENHSQLLDDSCLTETLARIYIKQKRYDKALQIIKNLSLKNPEKNVYFADQIRFLEKLIINIKK